MNQEKINTLATYLEQLPAKNFDIPVPGRDTCGTSHCIAGWLLDRPARTRKQRLMDWLSDNRDYLIAWGICWILAIAMVLAVKFGH